jgi:hypothetical protein
LLLEKAWAQTTEAFPGAIPFKIDVFRGDGWQLLMSDRQRCLRIGLFFRACLRAMLAGEHELDTRMAIALGSVDFVRERVSQGDGEAYRLSGHGLEAMPRKQRLILILSEDNQPVELTVIVRLLDAIVQGWTSRQALAIQGGLQGWASQKIAKKWPNMISQQAITKHLAGAQWPAVEAALLYVELSLAYQSGIPAQTRTRTDSPSGFPEQI